MKKKIIIIFISIVLILLAGLITVYSLEDKYQDDTDIVRLQHLDYYANLIFEYHEKNGKYPLQYEKFVAPSIVLIMNDIQENLFKDTNPNKNYKISDSEFFDELSKGLGREIDEKYDPQKYASSHPIMYIYMVDGDNFFFAAHFYHKNPFTREVRKNYNKMEVSNISLHERSVYSYDELKNNPKYIALLKRKHSKKSFFENLENEYKSNSRE